MDQETFQDRVRQVQERLYRISCGQLRDMQDRQDAVQEAILKAWRNRDRLHSEAYFETWLIRILINECHNLQRTQKRFVPLTQPPPETPDGPPGAEALREALWALPEKLRTPVLLHYMEGYTTGEIAQMLTLPAGTVRSRLLRARKALRRFLEEPDWEG